VSVTGKIAERARALLERISVDDNALSGIEPGELQAEVEARSKLRSERPPRPAEKNPRSRYAGAEATSAEARRQMAERRRKKIHAARDKRERERRRAEDEAFRRVKEQARQQGAGATPPPGGGSSSRRRSGGLGDFGRDPELVGAYKTLDLPYGSPIAEVKTAYRKLMRKYHPDLHNQSPKKQKAATELTMKVTQAYNVLERHLRD
jgi:DnaJ-domain-containing protein 1